MRTRSFVNSWRRRKSAAFDLCANSTAGRTVPVEFWGRPVEIYANANLSIYSGQACNGRCGFCVEELRPASRGRELALQKRVEPDEERYFAALDEALSALAPLGPSVSVTGGEPSIDPRLPRTLRTIAAHRARKRTVTTNGSGLLEGREGRTVLDWLTATGVRHLNISRAHPDGARNAELMGFGQAPSAEDLRAVARRTRPRGTRPRLSCVLLRGAVEDLPGVVAYLDFAAALGFDNVIFRQLMKTDAATTAPCPVVEFSDAHRVALEPILDGITADPRFAFRRQIVGYYYYVEVWRYRGVDAVFEEADLAQLERARRLMPGVVHELVFHPDGRLCSTWQPWDGVLNGMSAVLCPPAD